jgi:hypothetical protein
VVVAPIAAAAVRPGAMPSVVPIALMVAQSAMPIALTTAVIRTVHWTPASACRGS